jgi:chromosome segregation ATPase
MKQTVVEELKDEITELKLSDIRKDITSLRNTFGSKLDTLIGHVEKTNGSVARIQDQANITQARVEEHNRLIDKIEIETEKISEETRPIRWLLKNPRWLILIVVAIAYSLSIEEIRMLITKLFTS